MDQKLDELYKQGTEAFGNGDYQKAESLFRELLNINPDFADIQNKMGIICHQTNRPKLAAQHFEKALALNPEYTEASLNLAITYSDLGNYDKSRQIFEAASHFAKSKTDSKPALDPFIKRKLADEHFRVGNMYYQLSLLDDAIEEYKKALRLASNFADIITQLGISYRDKGRFDEAIKEFNNAKASNPRYVPARLHLGITYYSQGFYGLAEKEWTQALEMEPNNSALRTYLSFVKSKES